MKIDEKWLDKAQSTFKKWAKKRNKSPSDFLNPNINTNVQDIKDISDNKWKNVDWSSDWNPNDVGSIKKKETPEVKEVEKFRNVEPDDYFIITPKKIKSEIGDITEEILDRMNDIVLTCVNCGFRDLFVNFLGNAIIGGKGDLTCPNCSSKAVGIDSDKKHRWIEECLKGDVVNE